MNIGILGAGVVGKTMAENFRKLKYTVKVGTQHPEKHKDWQKKTGIDVISYEAAAAFGDMIVLCTKWEGTQPALTQAKNFARKVVIDVTNPLQPTSTIPTLAVAYPSSAGKQIQQWLPDAKVVKAFNIVPAQHMANPVFDEGTADLFICGNDEKAKAQVTSIAKNWGWNVHDMGDITHAYLIEALAMLWIRWGFLHKNWNHAFKLMKA